MLESLTASRGHRRPAKATPTATDKSVRPTRAKAKSTATDKSVRPTRAEAKSTAADKSVRPTQALLDPQPRIVLGPRSQSSPHRVLPYVSQFLFETLL